MSEAIAGGARAVVVEEPPETSAFGATVVRVADTRRALSPLSAAFFALALAGWIVLAAVVVARLIADRRRLLLETRSPSVLTTVAATAVLGERVVALNAVAA